MQMQIQIMKKNWLPLQLYKGGAEIISGLKAGEECVKNTNQIISQGAKICDTGEKI